MAGKFSIEAIFTAKDRFSGVMGGIQSKLGRFSTGASAQLAKFDRGAAKALGGLRSAAMVGAAGLTALGVAGYAGLKKLAEPTMAAEDALAKIATVITPAAGTVQDALAATKKAALDWSKSHVQSVTDYEEANYQMASAGLNSAQAIAGTNTALALATATFGEATDAGNLLATLYNNLGDKSRDSTAEFGRLGDVVAKTQALFQIKNLDQLNQGLTYGVPAAKMFGVSVEQLNTVLGTLNTAGLQGSMAGTAFSASMRQMSKASKELGFSLAKSADGGLDVVGTVENLEKKFGSFATMSDATKAKFQRAFGDEGVRGIALMLGKSKQLRTDLDRVTNSMGAAAAAQQLVENTRSNQLAILGNRIDAVKISLGDALLPVLERALPAVKSFVGAADAWATANGTLLRTEVSEALDKGRFAIELFASGLKRGATAVQSILVPFAALAGMFGGVSTWPVLVNDAGIAIGALVPILFGVMAASKLARAALFGIEFATKAVTAAVWLVNTAYRVYTATTILWTLASQQGLRAALSVLATTRLGTAATWLANAARGAWALVTQAATAIETLFIGEVVAGTAATEGAAGSMVAAEAATASLVLTLGAALAMVGALVLAWHEWKELQKAAGGHVGAGVKGLFNGKGFFGGIDAAMNEDARKEYERTHGAAAGVAPAAAGVSPAGAIPPVNAPGTPPGSDAPAAAPGAPAPEAPSSQGSQLEAMHQAQMGELIAALLANSQKSEKSVVELRVPPGITAEVKTPKAGVRNPVRVTPSGGPR